ncbi:hypothetical protein OO015_07040 [Thermomicrobium sp. 4228-Ro]|uniref:hypothetical protein n=1 Tax=Thermomicrobium sp. 4228-Ro TaxID=2993937 RepID=UPI0022492CB1|nr:hypothetical protein [Thermomicrobium sp. 4228-Ro]MCX2727252.1 hypothetical protein [Thermomicrobium sp. 4228-Ro]
MRRSLALLLVGVLVIAACRNLPVTLVATPTGLATPVSTVTPEPEVTRTTLVLPTPSVTVQWVGTCSLARVLEVYRSFLQALNDGDLPALRAVLGIGMESAAESRWFAVIPRESELFGTGLFTERPEGFLDWVSQRSSQHERWNVLEFVQIEPSSGSRVVVTAALLREADDFIAKPFLSRIELDCDTGVVRSMVAGAVGADTLPTSPSALLAEALAQRSLRPPEVKEPCPRSSWAFGNAVGEGPVYLAVGPDAVVNVPDHATGSTEPVPLDVVVSASERGPVLLRLFALADETPVPLGRNGSALFLEPSGAGERSTTLSPMLQQAGCYVLQADGATWQQSIVFETIAEPLAAFVPQLVNVALPVDLRLVSAWRDGPDTVRVGLVGSTLVARLSIGVGGPGGPTLGVEQRCERIAERIDLCWVPHPVWGWPQAAVWDDGMRRYQLVVLAGNRDAWSEDDLRTLVRRLSLPEDPARVLQSRG